MLFNISFMQFVRYPNFILAIVLPFHLVIPVAVDAQEINIVGNGTSIASGTTATSTSNWTDVGTGYIDNATYVSVKSFTIENTGSSTLTVSNITPSGTDAADFTISGISFPATVAANSSTTFTVTFLPRSVYSNPSSTPVRLARSATITISNNDSDEGTYTFNLAGTAGGQASVKLASYKSTVTGTPNETHGSAIGDLLATYSPVSEGNIAYYNGSTTQNGCGSNKGLAHGGGTGTGFTLTVTPLGVLPGQTWYLYYDDATVAGYPVRNTSGGAGSGTTMITGTGSSDVSVSDVALDGPYTDYLFYVDPGPSSSNTAGTVSGIADTTFGRSFSSTIMDANVNVADTDNDLKNNGIGNYTGSTLTIQRSGGVNINDAFSLNVSGKSYSLSGSNLIKNSKIFGTYTTSGNVIVVTFSGTEVIATSALVDEVAQSIVYTTSLTGDQTLSFDYIFNDGIASSTSVKKMTLDNTSPNISGGGGSIISPSSSTLVENETAVLQFTSNEIVTWSKTGGADQALFSVNATTGHLTFLSAPDFENPSDAGANNTYDVQVTATDRSGNTNVHVLQLGISNSTSEPIWTWTGATSTAWNLASNWTPATVPTGGASIIIPSGVSRIPALDQSRIIYDLSVASGNTVALSASVLTVQGAVSNNGTITAGVGGKLIMAGASSQIISGTGVIAKLEVNNASGVTIQTGAGNVQSVTESLIMTAGILTTNSNLTLKSDATGTARVHPIAIGASISGNVIVERFMALTTGGTRSGRAWRLLSIPVKGSGLLRDFFMGGSSGTDLTISANVSAQTANSGTVVMGHAHITSSQALAAGFDWIGVPNLVSSLRYYQPSSSGGSFGSTQVPTLSTNYNDAAQGYMVFVRGDRSTSFSGNSNASATTFRSVGTLNQGNVQVSVAPPATASHTLVGNPYMSALDLDAVYAANSSVIKNVFYLWDSRKAGSRNQGGYRTVSFNSGTSQWEITDGGSNGYWIESHTAFFVVPKDANTTSQLITISETHKSTGTPGIQPHGNQGRKSGSLFVNIELPDTTGSRNVVDGVILRMDDQNSEAKDPSDVPAITNLTNPSLWLSGQSGRLSIEGRPWPSDTSFVQMGTGGLLNASYLMRFMPNGMQQEGLSAWLVDQQKGKVSEIALDRETIVPFEVSATGLMDSSRFRLVFSMKKMTGVATPDDALDAENKVTVYPNPSSTAQVSLSIRNKALGKYTVKIYDSNGRLVRRQDISHQMELSTHLIKGSETWVSGTYLLELVDERGVSQVLKLVRN